MGKHYSVVVMVTVCLYVFLSVSETSESMCRVDAGNKHRMALTINSMRNERDEWVTKISASQNASVKAKNLDVDLTRSVVDCEGSYYINVQGILRDNAKKEPSLIPNSQGAPEGRAVHQVPANAEKSQNRSLIFHPECSSNVVIINNSRTLQKLKLKSGREGSALTNRPLMDNEIFTVRIDDIERTMSYGNGISIGITTHEPGTFEIPEHMNDIVTGTWMFYDNQLYHKSKYNTQGRDSKLKVGQRIGVMRSASGNLHYFVDGVDRGYYASNIPDKIYGVLECYGNLLQGTIVDSMSH